ncbi:MAG: TolC family protein [bacterium]|nr:TolC family protein [bacterium]
MTTPSFRLTAALVAACSSLGACASTYDSDLLERRARSVYRDGARARPQSPTPQLEDTAELAAYLDYGLANSAELRAAFETWLASTERVEQVSTLPEPRFTFGEYVEEVQTRTGPQERRFGISQAFPWPGELGTRARAEDRKAEAAWQRVEAERLRVAAEIEVAFHDYGFLDRELAITRELLELLRGLEPIVQSRIRGGGGQEDLLRLQVEIGRLEDELASVERRRPAASARLASALNLRGGPRVLPFPTLAEPETAPVDTHAAYELALARNPLLHELSEQLAVSREAEDLAGFRRKPSFALSLDVIQTGDARDETVRGSGNDPVVLGLSMSLPVWTSSYAAGEREARHFVRAARARIEAAEVQLLADVESEAFRVDDAARRIGLYRDTLLPRASESLELTLASYRTGGATLLDLIDSERALLEFELSLWRACRDFLQGDARLRALMGGDAR